MPNGLTPRDGFTLSIHQFVGSAATGSIACDSCSWAEPFGVPMGNAIHVGDAVAQAVSGYSSHSHKGGRS